MTPSGGLYAILDAHGTPPERLTVAAEAALAGGAGLLQYRDKRGDADATYAGAVALRRICRGHGVPLILNDDVALTAEVGADGVHLGRTDAAIAAARRRLGPAAIVGATCHNSVDAAAAAVAEGADYVSFGRFFASATKPGAPGASPAVLTRARERLNVPIVAIGGVNADNGAALVAAGADWLAVAGAVFDTDDVRAAAARVAALFGPRDESP